MEMQMGAMVVPGRSKSEEALPHLAPLLVFLACLSALFSSDLLVSQFGRNLSTVAKNTFIYGIQIGVWLSAALLLNRLVETFFWDGFVSKLSDRKVPRLPKDVTALVLFGLAAVGITATVFEQSVAGILATSGVASIVVGLALRNVIMDMFIGLAIHVERPFKIGDWIQIHRNRRKTHVVAKVIEINWRTTRLKTTENNMIVIPNNVIGTSILTNYMEPKPHFRIDLPFMIDFEIPAERASRILEAGIRSIAGQFGILENPNPKSAFVKQPWKANSLKSATSSSPHTSPPMNRATWSTAASWSI